MIDEANQSLEESGTPSHEIMVIVLHREFTAGSIGITLAGGADYESKDITVRKEKRLTQWGRKGGPAPFLFSEPHTKVCIFNRRTIKVLRQLFLTVSWDLRAWDRHT